MTLNTRMYVHDPIDPHDFFKGVQYIVGQLSDPVRLPEEQTVENEPSVDKSGWGGQSTNSWDLLTTPGQGLSAWIWVHYDPDGPYRAEDYFETDVATDQDEAYEYYKPACHLELSLDTAYAYSGPGGGCGALHAVLVKQIGTILDDMGIAWSWENEFTGEIFSGYTGLEDLAKGGVEASEWFQNDVLPVVGELMGNNEELRGLGYQQYFGYCCPVVRHPGHLVQRFSRRAPLARMVLEDVLLVVRKSGLR